MKKLIISLMALMIICAGSSAFAADETKVSIGLRAWNNTWTVTDPSTGDSIDSDNAVLMIGPSLNVKFSNNWFVGATYLATTSDYEFTYADSPPVLTGKLAYDRKDLDIMAGYMFNPQFGIFFGYKSIESTVTDKYTIFGTSYEDTLGTFEVTGPGIGILGNIPVGETVALYGNLSVMSLEYSEPGYTEDVSGASVEIGVAFAFSEQFSANVGFKSQTLSGDTIDNTFSGLTAGVTYTF